MKLDLDRVPRTLSESVQMIVESLELEEIEYIKNSKSLIECHHTVGRYFRNNWSLWDKECPLPIHFREVHKIWHADDMSGLILYGVWCIVRNEKPDYENEIKRYHNYWKGYGLDPFTGERPNR